MSVASTVSRREARQQWGVREARRHGALGLLCLVVAVAGTSAVMAAEGPTRPPASAGSTTMSGPAAPAGSTTISGPAASAGSAAPSRSAAANTSPPSNGPAPAADPGLEFWKNPEFQKAFVGSYATLPDREPKLTPEERLALEKLVPVLGTDLPAAATALAALARPDSSALIDFTLGNVQFQLERLPDAKRSYASAVQKFPTFLRAWKNLGLVTMRTGDMPEAIRALTRMIELGGGESLTYGLLGQALASRGDLLSAESAYRQALLLQSDSLDWKLGLVRCLFKLERFGEAADLSGELIASHPERSDLLALQASAFIGMKEPMRAAQDYEILARGGHATPEILFALGDIYVNESLMDLAGGAYMRALELDPAQSPARAFRAAEALAARGAMEPAKELLARMRSTMESRLDDAEKRRLLKLQARIDVAGGSGAESVATLEEIVALDPLDGEALMLLGQYYSRASQPEKASFYYERAASLEPFEADAKVRLAQILVGQSKFTEAVPLLRRAQELKPRDEVARYLEQVERVSRSRR